MIKIEDIIKTQELIETAAYITRSDNPFIYYENYLPGHSYLDILKTGNAESTESTENLISQNIFEKKITSQELVQILNQLIELHKLGTKVESKRIPLLSSEFKFKGYRRVEFSYEDSHGLYVITVTNKRKEIHIRGTVGG